MSTLAMRRGIETYDEYVLRSNRLVLDESLLYADRYYGVGGGPNIIDWLNAVIRDWTAMLWESRDIDARIRDINDDNLESLGLAADAVEKMAGELNVSLVMVTRAETSLKGATAEFAKVSANLMKAKEALVANSEDENLKMKVATLIKQYQMRQDILVRMTSMTNKVKAAYNKGMATKEKGKIKVLQADSEVQVAAARGQELAIENQSAAVMERLNDITAKLGGISFGSAGKHKDSLDNVELTVARRTGRAQGRADLNDARLSQQANDWLGDEVDLGNIDTMLKDDSVLAEAQKALATKVTTEAVK